MNKLDLLKEFKDMLYHNLLSYSSDCFMNKPKLQHIKEWKLTQEKISIIEEIIEDVKQNKIDDIWYLVRNDDMDVLGSFFTLNEAIAFAEKKKREYMRNYDNSKVYVEIEGESEKVYVAKGYEKEETEEFE